ncbi:hypothetical protein BRD17_08835 [Halobacteriales archaeon SW_7_68_16]|nr:MAG: hypothetical protein BRD17_08835 [Halobacteriales archaeon SW_7_68_16]
MDRADAVTALALAVGFLLVVAVENTLRSLGFGALGLAVYPVGYGTLVVVAWYVWIRPIDFGHGSDGPGGSNGDG